MPSSAAAERVTHFRSWLDPSRSAFEACSERESIPHQVDFDSMSMPEANSVVAPVTQPAAEFVI